MDFILFKRSLSAASYIDSGHPEVIKFAKTQTAGITHPIDKAIRLYRAVRDGFRYNAYTIELDPAQLKASYLLTRTEGYCIQKAILLAAALRVTGIPSRLHFYNVRNHIGTEKLTEKLGTDILVFHGITEIFLGEKWVKATPAFNNTLCEKLGVQVLEFNGREDSVFQEFDPVKGKFMEYLYDYGHFYDFPYKKFVKELKKHYPGDIILDINR